MLDKVTVNFTNRSKASKLDPQMMISEIEDEPKV